MVSTHKVISLSIAYARTHPYVAKRTFTHDYSSSLCSSECTQTFLRNLGVAITSTYFVPIDVEERERDAFGKRVGTKQNNCSLGIRLEQW